MTNSDEKSPTIQSNFFPMSKRDDAYSDQAQGTPNMGGVVFTDQDQPLAHSTKFTGCVALRKANGQIGHVPPPASQVEPLKFPRRWRRPILARQDDIDDVFGASQYGKYDDGKRHNRTNIMLSQGNDGRTLTSQSMFSQDYIETVHIPWMARPQY